MKFFLLLVLGLVTACNEQVNAEDLEKKIFPLIQRHQTAGKMKCVPSFLTYREKELTIYCEPVDKTDPQMTEQLRKEITEIADQWMTAENIAVTHVRTRFTDEITTESAK